MCLLFVATLSMNRLQIPLVGFFPPLLILGLLLNYCLAALSSNPLLLVTTFYEVLGHG